MVDPGESSAADDINYIYMQTHDKSTKKYAKSTCVRVTWLYEIDEPKYTYKQSHKKVGVNSGGKSWFSENPHFLRNPEIVGVTPNFSIVGLILFGDFNKK